MAIEEKADVEGMITMLHSIHLDNSRLQYYARRPGPKEKPVSIMPVTPFVYEFFLFNSLYQVDWKNSFLQHRVIYHSEESSETQDQRAFISFLKQYAETNPSAVYRAFEPLAEIQNLDGEWTQVKPDSRISKDLGNKFFGDISLLQTVLKGCGNPADMPTSKKVFDPIKDCVHFVYLVRNNIFHGSKTLGETLEKNQKRRIEVYELFLKGVTSLFFLATGKQEAACDIVPSTIYSSSLPISNTDEVFDQAKSLRAISKSLMKIGDSRLISRFTKVFVPPLVEAIPNQKASLFYPSAGSDLITPIFLGLPYCSQFYFYDKNHSLPLSLPDILRGMTGVSGIARPPQWVASGGNHYFDFEFNNIVRRVHYVRTDNADFLQKDAKLKFYFHRGDSMGEGGSGQKWDSEFLPELLKKIPESEVCLYLSDGQPGGFDERHSLEIVELNLPFVERGRFYFCGKLANSRSSSKEGWAHRAHAVIE